MQDIFDINYNPRLSEIEQWFKERVTNKVIQTSIAGIRARVNLLLKLADVKCSIQLTTSDGQELFSSKSFIEKLIAANEGTLRIVLEKKTYELRVKCHKDKNLTYTLTECN